MNYENTKEITEMILKIAQEALKETGSEPESVNPNQIQWPINCVVGPGLEGAIACETKIGHVNGSKGVLIYRGYNIYDLCAYSNFEEVCYLLIHGSLPTEAQLDTFKKKLRGYAHIPHTKRLLMSFPVEKMNPMSALRLGTNLMRQDLTDADMDGYIPDFGKMISADEDSIPMETKPKGEKHAIYEFKKEQAQTKLYESAYHLIAGVASLTAAIARIRQGHFPIEPDPELSHAANFLYMMTGRRPTAIEERIMDIALILHADHGMNASTFASMVVASTLSDMYLSVGSGIAALTGFLHGGANEQVISMLKSIGSVKNVKPWFKKAQAKKIKIMGFGHRVYKTIDPRARVLADLSKYIAKNNSESIKLLQIANALEKEVVSTLGKEKRVFPNVDLYSGILYRSMGIIAQFYTPIFAVSRVAGWTARIIEYLNHNRIFRPRALYIGTFDKSYLPIDERDNIKKEEN